MALCAGLALLDSPLHPSSPYSCCYLRSAWPSPPSAVAGAARGTTSLHVRHDIGPASQHTHWHTPHPTPPPLRAWGVQRGDCERVRPCIAPDRDRAPPPCLLADGQDAVLDAKLLFESRADRSRPWFAGAHFVSGLRVLVPVVRTRGSDARRSALARSRIADMLAERRHACSGADGGGAGDTGRCRTMSCSTRPFTLCPPPVT